MKIKSLLTCAALTVGMAGAAQAQLAGHNVILVHGFQPDNLYNQPSGDAQIRQNGENYWSDYWNTRAEARFDWNSYDRIEEGTAQRLYDDAVALSQAGTCSNGCVIVTHSTGDLVTRYFLENQEDWLAAAGHEPLNILTVLDFAGAGGGTEIADTAVSMASSNNWFSWAAMEALQAWLGAEVGQEDLGVLYDLQPAAARNLAVSPSSVPRLRFAGAGTDYFSLTGGFITGTDDGVVPTHSSCGAVNQKAYDSCSKDVAFDGYINKGDINGPATLFHNHYAVLMGEDTSHSGSVGAQTGVRLTYVDNNFDANGIAVDFNTEKVNGWFWDYRYVKNSSGRSMSETVYTTLDN